MRTIKQKALLLSALQSGLLDKAALTKEAASGVSGVNCVCIMCQPYTEQSLLADIKEDIALTASSVNIGQTAPTQQMKNDSFERQRQRLKQLQLITKADFLKDYKTASTEPTALVTPDVRTAIISSFKKSSIDASLLLPQSQRFIIVTGVKFQTLSGYADRNIYHKETEAAIAGLKNVVFPKTYLGFLQCDTIASAITLAFMFEDVDSL